MIPLILGRGLFHATCACVTGSIPLPKRSQNSAFVLRQAWPATRVRSASRLIGLAEPRNAPCRRPHDVLRRESAGTADNSA